MNGFNFWACRSTVAWMWSFDPNQISHNVALIPWLASTLGRGRPGNDVRIFALPLPFPFDFEFLVDGDSTASIH